MRCGMVLTFLALFLSGIPRGAAAELPLCGSTLPLDVVGLEVTPHVFSSEIRYRRLPDPGLGALVRILVKHREGPSKTLSLDFLFQGKTPTELLTARTWAWHDLPDGPLTLAPGAVGLITFNARVPAWGAGTTVSLDAREVGTGRQDSFKLSLTPGPVRLSQVVGLAVKPDALTPDTFLIHSVNESPSPARIVTVRAYAPHEGGLRPVTQSDPAPGTGLIPARDRSATLVRLGTLPPVRGLLEVIVDVEGRLHPLWARLRFKQDRFDIGSGWLETPTRAGIVPLKQTSFLRVLQRMHINLTHAEHVPGYTDATGPEGLYTHYPLRFMSGFADVKRFNSDDWARKIHGVDALGEPQMGKTPMHSFAVLRRYDAARYPTTVTLSQDSGFRDYAGLSDFPHFDAYRVNAPAADSWSSYDRWNGASIRWGAPLEGVGAMTRTLRSLSRPVPIAFWTQNAHYNWGSYGGRARRSPTPDEIRMQAYQGLANGVIGLYWYSLEASSLILFRDVLEETTRIGREIRLLEDLYLKADASFHRRVLSKDQPDLDLSALVGPEAALLFALDLSYRPDLEKRIFVFSGPREIEAEYPLPGFLRSPKDVFRVDATGVHPLRWVSTATGVRIQASLDRVGIYVATPHSGLREQLKQRLDRLRADEKAIGFDPAASDADFAQLAKDLGVALPP